jgi:hypothetical protein
VRKGRFELLLRIVVEEPFPGVQLALQRGKDALEPPAAASPEAIVFDLEITVDGAMPDGRPRLLGPHIQAPAERFVYLCVGRYAGDAASEWAGRIKVPLGGIGWPEIEALATGRRLEGRISGTGKRGPALATVPILPPGWR